MHLSNGKKKKNISCLFDIYNLCVLCALCGEGI